MKQLKVLRDECSCATSGVVHHLLATSRIRSGATITTCARCTYAGAHVQPCQHGSGGAARPGQPRVPRACLPVSVTRTMCDLCVPADDDCMQDSASSRLPHHPESIARLALIAGLYARNELALLRHTHDSYAEGLKHACSIRIMAAGCSCTSQLGSKARAAVSVHNRCCSCTWTPASCKPRGRCVSMGTLRWI